VERGGGCALYLGFRGRAEPGGGGGLGRTPNFLIFKSTNLNNFLLYKYIIYRYFNLCY